MKHRNYQLYIFTVLAVFIFFISYIGKTYTFSGNAKLQPLKLDYVKSQTDSKGAAQGHFTADVPQGRTVFLRTRGGVVQIRKNGESVFRQKSQTDYADGTLLFSSEWMDFYSPGFETGDTVMVTVEGEEAEKSLNMILSNLYTGDRLELLKVKMMERIYQVVCGMLILGMGIAYLVSIITIWGMEKGIPGGYPACGMLLISGAVCTLIDYSFITLVFKNLRMITNVDYLMQGLICIFLLVYLSSFAQTKATRSAILGFVLLSAAIIVLYYILCGMRICTMEECIMWQFPISAVLILAALLLLAIECVQAKNFRERPILWSGAVLAILALTEITHFYLTHEYWGIVFQFGLLLFACLQFGILMKNAQERILQGEQVERELAQSRISIMLSQIQPHFLYNTLSAIAYLCDKNPKLARKATEEFAQYLRGNMDSLKHRNPVPFSTELRHLEIYLSLEKLRFEDELHIVYDIQTKDFMLPSLTVQPLVENAVKYGVGKAEDGGTVRISTRECESYYEIVVEDDGVGYDPYVKQEDGRTHIGIDNVKSRLWSMSKGTLEIESRKGEGTTATIRLPKEGEGNEYTGSR